MTRDDDCLVRKSMSLSDSLGTLSSDYEIPDPFYRWDVSISKLSARTLCQ